EVADYGDRDRVVDRGAATGRTRQRNVCGRDRYERPIRLVDDAAHDTVRADVAGISRAERIRIVCGLERALARRVRRRDARVVQPSQVQGRQAEDHEDGQDQRELNERLPGRSAGFGTTTHGAFIRAAEPS